MIVILAMAECQCMTCKSCWFPRTQSPGAQPTIERLLLSYANEPLRSAWYNGFVSYSLVRTADGGFSVTVYEEKAGIDKRSRLHGIGLRGTGPLSAAFQRLS